jgi:hypothetical protein
VCACENRERKAIQNKTKKIENTTKKFSKNNKPSVTTPVAAKA